jgi:hypothetical protein
MKSATEEAIVGHINYQYFIYEMHSAKHRKCYMSSFNLPDLEIQAVL